MKRLLIALCLTVLTAYVSLAGDIELIGSATKNFVSTYNGVQFDSIVFVKFNFQITTLNVTSPNHPAFTLVAIAKGNEPLEVPNTVPFPNDMGSVYIRFDPHEAQNMTSISDSIVVTAGAASIVIHLNAIIDKNTFALPGILFEVQEDSISMYKPTGIEILGFLMRQDPSVTGVTVSQPTHTAFFLYDYIKSTRITDSTMMFDDGDKLAVYVVFDYTKVALGVRIYDSVTISSGGESIVFKFSAMYDPTEAWATGIIFDRPINRRILCGDVVTDSTFLFNFTDEDLTLTFEPISVQSPNLPIDYTTGTFVIPAHGRKRIDVTFDTRTFDPRGFVHVMKVSGAFNTQTQLTVDMYDTTTTGWAAEGPLRFRSLNMSFGRNDTVAAFSYNRTLNVVNGTSKTAIIDSIAYSTYESVFPQTFERARIDEGLLPGYTWSRRFESMANGDGMPHEVVVTLYYHMDGTAYLAHTMVRFDTSTSGVPPIELGMTTNPAKIGQTTSAIFTMKNDLPEACSTAIVTLRYNASVLSPVTPRTKDDTYEDGDRISTFSITPGARSAGSILGVIEFIAALGNSSSTAIKVTDFTWFDNAKIPVDRKTRVNSATVSVEGSEGLEVNAGSGPLDLQVSPNPASNASVLAMSYKHTGSAFLKLYNGMGHMIIDLSSYITLPTGTVSLSLGGLATGSYTLRLSSGSYTHIRRLVITN